MDIVNVEEKREIVLAAEDRARLRRQAEGFGPSSVSRDEPNRRQRRADKSARKGTSSKRGPNAKHVHTRGKP